MWQKEWKLRMDTDKHGFRKSPFTKWVSGPVFANRFHLCSSVSIRGFNYFV